MFSFYDLNTFSGFFVELIKLRIILTFSQPNFVFFVRCQSTKPFVISREGRSMTKLERIYELKTVIESTCDVTGIFMLAENFERFSFLLESKIIKKLLGEFSMTQLNLLHFRSYSRSRWVDSSCHWPRNTLKTRSATSPTILARRKIDEDKIGIDARECCDEMRRHLAMTTESRSASGRA
jgi:hypothetical protein